MKDIGLSKKELTEIISVFLRYPEIKNVILFGSRAKGISRPNSDIDLAVDGTISDLQVEALAMELDELAMPYKFDVKSVSGICNPALKDHIARAGIKIFSQ